MEHNCPKSQPDHSPPVLITKRSKKKHLSQSRKDHKAEKAVSHRDHRGHGKRKKDELRLVYFYSLFISVTSCALCAQNSSLRTLRLCERSFPLREQTDFTGTKISPKFQKSPLFRIRVHRYDHKTVSNTGMLLILALGSHDESTHVGLPSPRRTIRQPAK